MYRYKFILLFFLLHVFIWAQSDYQITRINFINNKTFKKSKLKNQILLKRNNLSNKIFFWKERNYFDDTILTNDIKRLIYYYQSQGFLDIQIEPEIIRNDSKQKLELNFHIRENKPILVEYIIFTIDSESVEDVNNIKLQLNNNIDIFSLKKSTRFKDSALNGDKQKIINLLIDDGFPYCLVDQNLIVDKLNKEVTVELIIEPGPLCHYGPISITGNKKLSTEIIENQSLLVPSDKYQQSMIHKSQRQMQQLGMFKYVTIKSNLSDDYASEIPIQIIVNEASRFSSKFGIGYGIEDKFRISLILQKLGFLGGIRKAELYVKHSTLEPYYINFKFTQPSFLNSEGSLIMNPFLEKLKEKSYTIQNLGLNTKYKLNVDLNSSSYFNYTLEQVELDLEESIEEEVLNSLDDIYNKSSISLGFDRDTSSPAFTPNRGYYSAIVLTYSGLGFNSKYHYYQSFLEFRKYYKIIDKWSLATKIKLGGMKKVFKEESTPIEDRFYAGGSYSIRGWSRGEIGPKTEDDYPIGGNSIFEGSSEMRFPIWKSLSGVYFIDFGNVWSSSFTCDLSDLHYASGIGLRFKTPIGPLRADIAIPIFEEVEQIQFYISIGEAF